jgi:hypothetical protein
MVTFDPGVDATGDKSPQASFQPRLLALAFRMNRTYSVEVVTRWVLIRMGPFEASFQLIRGLKGNYLCGRLTLAAGNSLAQQVFT